MTHDLPPYNRTRSHLNHLILRMDFDGAICVLESPGEIQDLAGFDNEGRTLLHLCAGMRQMDARLIRALVSRGIAVDAPKYRTSTPPLHYATGIDNLPVAATLLELGANPNSRNISARTPLHDAAWVASVPLGEMLLAYGAEIDPHDEKGFTPLASAIVTGGVEFAAWILSRGASLDALDECGPIIDEALARPEVACVIQAARAERAMGAVMPCAEAAGRRCGL